MKLVICFLVLLASSSTIQADELRFIISGKALHIGSNGQKLNESNYGFGFEYDFEEKDNWIPLITGASFEDSNFNTSRYLGVGTKRRYKLGDYSKGLNFDAGVFGFAMTRKHYNDDKPFLGVLPFVTLSNDWSAINLTYVPKFEKNMLPFWYFQFSIKMAEF